MTAASMEPTAASYRVSALASGLRVMWRAAGIALPVILANLVLQAGLTYLDIQSGFSASFLFALAVSALAALVLYAVLAAGALESVAGTGGFGSVLGRARRHVASFAAWALVQWLLILAVSLVQPLLVVGVAALTPYLPLAAMDGRGNAIGANFRAIGRAWGRWLVTTAVLLVAALVLYVLSAANTFFIKGTPASAIFWLVIPLVAWWLLTAWALIYRKALPDAAPRTSG
jgi:hypothetical protein